MSTMTMNRVINLNSIGKIPQDFWVKYHQQIELGKGSKYVGLDKISMHYSWHNVTSDNNTLRISLDRGINWSVVTITPGIYNCDRISEFLKEFVNSRGSSTNNIGLEFDEGTYKVLFTLERDLRADLTLSKFNELIGFDKKVLWITEYGVRLPNITRDVDEIQVRCNLVSNSIYNDEETNVLFTFPTAEFRSGFPFVVEPKRVSFHKMSNHLIDEIHIYITDSNGKILDLNGINIFITLIIGD